MANDDRSRPTRPPLQREEDSPPGQYREPGRPIPEAIGKIALRAPRVTVPSQHEEVLRALASTEGRMLAEMSDLRDEEQARQIARQQAFEDEIRSSLRELVVREVRSIPPPPAEPKKRFEWAHLQYVAAFVVALTGLIALILGAQKPSAEVTKRFDEIDKKLDLSSSKLEAHIEAESAQRSADREQDYKYNLDVRSWVTDVLERAASVKIDDPPGTPKRDQLGFYPAPRIDSHKITDTHIVQPRDPYPVPPPP